jgi:predicted ArsR family transcriptional regulator
LPIFKGGKSKVDINAQVGETAGKVWHLLKDDGPQTLAQLKKKLNSSSELVAFALGWLAREGKVDIVQDKKSFKVALK